jgi:hypothetical protein
MNRPAAWLDKFKNYRQRKMTTLNEKMVSDTSARLAVWVVLTSLGLLNTSAIMGLVKDNYFFFLYFFSSVSFGIYILYDYRSSQYTSAFIDFAILELFVLAVLLIVYVFKIKFLDFFLDPFYRPFLIWSFSATIFRLLWPANHLWPITGLYSFFRPPTASVPLRNKMIVWSVLLALMPIAYLSAKIWVIPSDIILPLIGLIGLKLNGRKSANAVITTVSESERLALAATELATALEKLKAELILRIGTCDIVNISNDPRAFLHNILNEDELILIKALEVLRPDVRLELIIFVKSVMRDKDALKKTPAANDANTDGPNDQDG